MHSSDQRTLTIGRSIIVRLVSSLTETGFDKNGVICRYVVKKLNPYIETSPKGE